MRYMTIVILCFNPHVCAQNSCENNGARQMRITDKETRHVEIRHSGPVHGGLTLIGVEAMVCRMLQVLQLEVLAETVHEWVAGKEGDGGAAVSRESFDDLWDKWQASISQKDAVEGGKSTR